jgi:glycosyltransferase involved in cell wall biosynthesis
MAGTLKSKGNDLMEVTVSVIIPTHNRAALLEKALNSVFQQSFRDWEIIVVNDASTDTTLAMLEQLTITNQRVRVLSNAKPLGGGMSRNVGIEASRGKWIAFLDDDDTWLPEKLTLQLEALSKHPHAVACSCAYTVNYPLAIQRVVQTPTLKGCERLLSANILGGASVCICKAAVLRQIGGFDKKLRSSQDWDLWLRLCEQGEIISVSKPLVDYQVHFSYRISNDMRGKYYGARRFYFKHKSHMHDDARKANLSFICFIQSRQSYRPWASRFKKLMMAVKYSSTRTGFNYVLSSLPRMIFKSRGQATG